MPEGSSLAIYSLKGDEGSIVVHGGAEASQAGTGGNRSEGTGRIAIYGGNVDAKGAWDGAGIGGGEDAGGCDVSIRGDSVVDARSNTGAAIGRGEDSPDDNPGQVHLDDLLKVTCYDEGYKLVPATERAGYCAYRNHVKVEPCEHKTGSYEKCGECHIMHCYACGESVEQGHDFKEDGSCRACHYVKPAPVFADATWGCDDRFQVSFPVTIPEDYAVSPTSATACRAISPRPTAGRWATTTPRWISSSRACWTSTARGQGLCGTRRRAW